MSFKIEIIATFGEKEFHFGDTTELRVGSGPFDNIKVKHAGIGECHLILKRRGDRVKIECNNAIGFWMQSKWKHIKVVAGYENVDEKFSIYLGRSVNPNFKAGDSPETKYVDASNTTIVVFFNQVPVARAPAPVARAPAPVARAPVMAVKTLSSIPEEAEDVEEVEEVEEAKEAEEVEVKVPVPKWAPSRAGGACKNRKTFQESQLDDTAADDSDGWD